MNFLRFVDIHSRRPFLVTTVYEKCHTPEGPSYIERAKGLAHAICEDRPFRVAVRDAGESCAKDGSCELRDRDAANGVLSLGVVLPDRAATGAQHDRTRHGDRHPAGTVLDVAYAESEAIADAQRGAEKHFDDVAHLTIGLGAIDVGSGPPATGGVADCADLARRSAPAARPSAFAADSFPGLDSAGLHRAGEQTQRVD